ncbi:MAG: Holliday junction branch migration DNA helicase RuvB, partial [Kofleriaceae bacterium]
MVRKKHEDGAGAGAGAGADDDPVVRPSERANERTWQAALRPKNFDEYIGQREMIDNLKVSVRAARQNGWALD